MTRARSEQARVIALVGGKGGVGTTLLAANMAIQMARQGRETFLLDLAATGPSAHAQAGLTFPTRHLGERLPPEDVVGGRPSHRHPERALSDGPDLTALAVAGGTPNLKVIAGVPDMAASPARPDAFGAALLAEAADLPADLVVADLGSDRSRAARLACRAASCLLLVTTPEPESVRGMLRLHSAVLYGLLEEAVGAEGAAELGPTFASRGLRGVLEELRDQSRAYHRLLEAVTSRRFGLILNQVRTQTDLETATRVGAVLSMVQAVVIDPVLSLEYDLSAVQATGEGKVLCQRYPNATVARGLDRLIAALTAPAPRERKPRGGDRYAPLQTWHHYRLLGLDPKASPREVQRHYEWIRAPFLPGGEGEAVADRSHMDAVLGRVEAAYRALIFLESRREYDRQLVASGVLERSALRVLADEVDAAEAREVREAATERRQEQGEGDGATLAAESARDRSQAAAATATASAGTGKGRPRRAAGGDAGQDRQRSLTEAASEKDGGEPAAQVRDDEPPAQADGPEAVPEEPGTERRYRGATLRALRQRRRLDVERIAAVTKIRAPQIEALEAERYEALPVPVFLRGFLKAYALCLDLNPDEVVRDYMAAYEAWSRMRV